MATPAVSLRIVKVTHTVTWAFFAGCILALPVVARRGNFTVAAVLIGITLAEVLILLANGMRCPLTDVAARFTEDRRGNFDIYLPLWLARYNKVIFGSLFVAGLIVTLVRWFGWPGEPKVRRMVRGYTSLYYPPQYP